MAGHKIVENDEGIADALQRLAGVGEDVSGAPRHQDRGALNDQWRST